MNVIHLMHWYIDIWGYLGGFFACIRFVPQIYKAIKIKSTNDISWGLLILSAFSQIFTIIYAYLIKSYPILVSITLALCQTCIMTMIKSKYDTYTQN